MAKRPRQQLGQTESGKNYCFAGIGNLRYFITDSSKKRYLHSIFHTIHNKYYISFLVKCSRTVGKQKISMNKKRTKKEL